MRHKLAPDLAVIFVYFLLPLEKNSFCRDHKSFSCPLRIPRDLGLGRILENAKSVLIDVLYPLAYPLKFSLNVLAELFPVQMVRKIDTLVLQNEKQERK